MIVSLLVVEMLLIKVVRVRVGLFIVRLRLMV